MVVDARSSRFKDIASENTILELVSHGHIFTEGPVWNAREGCLLWTDIVGNTIWKWTPGVGRSVVLRPSGKANGLTLDQEGRLLAAGWSSRSVWRLNHDGSITPLATHYQGQKLGTPNDIVALPDGAIYFTDPPGGVSIVGMEGEDLQQYLDFSGVYRLDPKDCTLTLLTTEVEGCNGLAFSPDTSLLYVNDTGARHIKVFNVQPDGTLSSGRLFANVLGDEPGNPDGMKVDTAGNLYCTGPGGIHVFDTSGEYLGRIRVPEHCSNMAWGDADWKSLYITARGFVYRVRLNIPGMPV